MVAPALVALATSLGPKIFDLISEVIPDTDKARRAAEKITAAVTDQAHEIALAQIENNRQESMHRSVFIAGWRPSVGWISSAGLAFNYLLIPAANIYLKLRGTDLQIDQMDLGPLLTLLTGMLGFGALRTYEKGRGLTR